MANAERNDRLFTTLLSNHEGWPLWNKYSTRDLEPGVFGYFDSDGAWKEIAMLRDDEQLRRGWNQLEKSIEVKPNTGRITWGPKVSSHMHNWSFEPELGVPLVPGLELSATFKLQHGHRHGAVMVTAAPITQTMTVDDRPILKWIKANASKIMEQYGSEVKEHGLWIITKTYQTSRCGMALLHSEESEVSIGLTVDVAGVLSLGPGVSWSHANQESTSVMYEDEDCGVVVMICGINIRKKTFSSTSVKTEDRREKQRILRGGAEDKAVPRQQVYTIETVDNDEPIELSVEMVPPPSKTS